MDSRVLSNTTVQNHQFFITHHSLWSNCHIHTWQLENHGFDYTELFQQVMSLLLKIVSRFVIAFLQMSKHLLILWLQSSSAVILELPKIKCLTVLIVSPCVCHEEMGPNAMIFIFWMWSLCLIFSLSSSDSLVTLHFLPWRWCILHIWGYWYFSKQSWFEIVLHPFGHFTWYNQHII